MLTSVLSSVNTSLTPESVLTFSLVSASHLSGAFQELHLGGRDRSGRESRSPAARPRPPALTLDNLFNLSGPRFPF